MASQIDKFLVRLNLPYDYAIYIFFLEICDRDREQKGVANLTVTRCIATDIKLTLSDISGLLLAFYKRIFLDLMSLNEYL